MNVLLVSQFFNGGGLERMVRLLAEELVRSNMAKCTLFAFDGEVPKELVKRLEARGVTVFFQTKQPGFSLRTAQFMAKIIREQKIDVIHTHESAPLMYACIARFLAMRWVAIVHTQHSFVHLHSKGFIARYDKTFQRLAQAVTAVSDQVKQKYLDLGVSENRVTVVDNGIEMAEESSVELQHRQRVRSQLVERYEYLQPFAHDYWLLGLARLHPQKGQDHLIKIWRSLDPELRRKSVLLFVGPETSPGEKQRLVQLADKSPDSDRIFFVGETQSPLDWMQACSIYLSGSEYEGMPLSPMEAAGAGAELILSKIAGHQLLQPIASLYDLKDEAEGAGFVRTKLLSGYSKDTAKERRNFILKNYSLQAMSKKYFDIYRKATKSRLVN